MSKFCGNCGTQLEDDARICGQCGTPYSGDTNNKQQIPGINKMSLEKKRRIKFIVKLSVVAIVLIIITVIAVNIISFFTGYKGAVNKAINAYKNYDIETLLTMSSDISFNGMDATQVENSISQSVSAKLDALEAEAGHDMNLSYEIIDSYKLSDRKYQEFLKYIENNYNYDSSDISEVYLAKIKVTAKGSLGQTSVINNNLYLINERSDWYLYNGYIGTSY